VSDSVFIFVDRANPIALMNLQITGQFTSPVYAALDESDFRERYERGDPDFLPFVPNAAVSTGFMSPFTAGVISDYMVEYDAELARRAHHPSAPSRLTGIYAFETQDACEEAHRRYGWNLAEVVEFRVKHALRSCRVNMEIVSLARHAYRTSMLDAATKDALWQAYWSGADGCELDLPTPDCRGRRLVEVDALWELLIDGALIRSDGAHPSV
jgi:hypothetical protein